MTEETLFGQCFRLLDATEPGERAAALNKIASLRPKFDWPSFGDVHRKWESPVVTPEQLDQIKTANAGLAQANDALTQENAVLRENNEALTKSVAAWRAIAWAAVNWQRVVGVAVAAALLYGGYHYWSEASAAPDKRPTASVATDKKQSAEDAALSAWLHGVQWAEGESAPIVIKAAGVELWAVVRSSVDSNSHADGQGRPVSRHCLQVFTAPVTRADGLYLSPPDFYALFGLGWIRWDARSSVECRNPNSKGYE